MKIKTTEKEIKNGFNIVIGIGYCRAQNLLRYQDEYAYTCGVYGWKSDIIKIDNNTAISTGYQPIHKTTYDYNTLNIYEKDAEKIANDYTIPYDERVKKINDLLNEFIKTAVLN